MLQYSTRIENTSRFLHPTSSDIATVATVAGAVVRPIAGVPVIATLWVFKISTAYLKMNGTITFVTLDPISRPTAILTLFRISESSCNDHT